MLNVNVTEEADNCEFLSHSTGLSLGNSLPIIKILGHVLFVR